MKNTSRLLTASALSIAILGSMPSFAQDHRDDHPADHHDDKHPPAEHHDDHAKYVHHEEWKKGYHLRQEDWSRGERIDYHAYHLNAPPRGYEWRAIDGNYVLAAVATGVVASVIVASSIH